MTKLLKKVQSETESKKSENCKLIKKNSESTETGDDITKLLADKLFDKYGGLLKPKDVMEILRLQKDTVYALFKSADFPSKKIANTKYISVKNLCVWLDAHDIV